MYFCSADQALRNRRENGGYSQWNASPSSEIISTNQENASRRIFEDYAKLRPSSPPKTQSLSSPVFTMGSCFAREIEKAITNFKGNIVSMDNDLIDRPEFRDTNGNPRSGFFHRFTPKAMLQEFQIAVDELPGWELEDSLLFNSGESCLDFNYWEAGLPKDRDSTLRRREIARQLVGNFKDSSLIILTLGFNETWLHKPKGFHCNKIDPKYLHSHKDEFELHVLDCNEVLECLTAIHDLIQRHHNTGDYQLVVTISPVPIQISFQPCDIIIANEYSKSTLRAAAGSFCASRDNVSYFPSYEMVRLTRPDLAWRPDRVHVNKSMVNAIVQSFMKSYFDF
jgi:hypothetical protein